MGRLTGSSIYLDTNAMIQFVESENRNLRTHLEDVFSDGVRILTSELTLAEALVGPIRDGDLKTAAAYESLFSDAELLQCVVVDRDIWRRSAELRAELGGKLPDTVHVATAILRNCSVLISSDKRLRVPRDLRVLSIDDIVTLRTFL